MQGQVIGGESKKPNKVFQTILWNSFCYGYAMPSKAKRLQIFFQRLEAATPTSSADEAFGLLVGILNAVENEFSGVPYRPERWRTDGRMYPPREDSRVKFPGHPSLWKYRNKGHYTFIGLNGSIRIETLESEILLDKPGQDGRRAGDLGD